MAFLPRVNTASISTVSKLGYTHQENNGANASVNRINSIWPRIAKVELKIRQIQRSAKAAPEFVDRELSRPLNYFAARLQHVAAAEDCSNVLVAWATFWLLAETNGYRPSG